MESGEYGSSDISSWWNKQILAIIQTIDCFSSGSLLSQEWSYILTTVYIILLPNHLQTKQSNSSGNMTLEPVTI